MKNFKLVKTTAALALGASVVTAAVVPGATDASAASKYKISNGKLVNAKTGKVVKGYVVFKSKLYYNGKVKKGYKTVGSGKTIKLYYNGSLKKGYKTARDNKLLFYNGSLKKGYKTAGNGERLYKDGHLDKGYEVYGDVEKDPSLYYNGYLKSGYKTANNATLLFYNGKLKQGYKTASNDTRLYKDGRIPAGLVKADVNSKFYNDGKLATGIFKYEDKEIMLENGVEVPTEVKSVSAVNSKTITLTGTNLPKLTVADIKVADNTVTGITFSADRTTATVTVKDELAVNNVTKVTVKDASFDVTYKIEAKQVSVVAGKTYDDDTANQSVAITIDGKPVTAQELLSAGYNVTFTGYAKSSGGTALTTLFKTPATGELNSTLDNGTTGLAQELNTAGVLPTAVLPVAGVDVYVQVKITKGSEVIESEISPIKIKNIDLAADGITKTTLTNYGADKGAVIGTPADSSNTDNFVQSSRTLTIGDKAEYTAIKVKAKSEETTVKSNYTVASSNPAVVSVTKAGVLKAEGPGTATITITYGGATTTETVTVVNGKREASKVTVDNALQTLAKGATGDAYVTVVDQFGDPFAGTLTVVNSDSTVATVAGTVAVSTAGKAPLTFTAVKAGSTSVTFKDAVGAAISSNQVKVNVTANADLKKYVLSANDGVTTDTLAGGYVTGAKAVEFSTDTTLDMDSDKYLTIDLTGVNSEGNPLAAADQKIASGEYDVEVSQSRDGVLNAIGGAGTFFKDNGGSLTIQAGTLTGTATITVKNHDNNTIVGSITVTVTKVGYNVTSASFQDVQAPTFGKTITFKDVLKYKEADSSKDPVISGLGLTKDAAQPIRLALTAGSGAKGDLYIDLNADGKYDPTDVKVGALEIALTGTFDATNAAAVDVITGMKVQTGDNGTILFKVVDKSGNVVGTKAITVKF